MFPTWIWWKCDNFIKLIKGLFHIAFWFRHVVWYIIIVMLLSLSSNYFYMSIAVKMLNVSCSLGGIMFPFISTFVNFRIIYNGNVRTPIRRGVLDKVLSDKVCQWLATGRWFYPGTPVSSTNKTVSHDITEILLKVALNTTTLIMYA